MNGDTGLFRQMCNSAIDELADGKKGNWRELPSNVLIMACFGMLTNHLSHKITRPLWFFAGSVATLTLGHLVNLFLLA